MDERETFVRADEGLERVARQVRDDLAGKKMEEEAASPPADQRRCSETKSLRVAEALTLPVRG